ncbi:MAG TPA: DUF1214 domain-containing protein [Deltaproteobacteria bacterium]|nr:DUF1214 domain-containing protein [Deltaproteobacteria bacterium]
MSQTESRRALREFIELLKEVDERWAGPEWNLQSDDDVAEAHRALMHMVEGGIGSFFEYTPERPRFYRIVSPSRKFTGDNGDAIYHDAPLRDDLRYRIRGRMAGAVYVSFTLELDTTDGSIARKTGGVLNDTMFDVADDGSFEIFLGGEARDRNWLPLTTGASRVTSRHYFEEEDCVAADPTRNLALEIECLDETPPPPRPDDASVAAGIRRAIRFVRSRTLEMPPMSEAEQPPFVSRIPNRFPAPVTPGDFGLAAFDAAYSMAPYVIGPDQALVMRARWPECRFANVCLWNRFQQTYDYANRTVSLNRTQARLEDDGSVRIVIAHRDPGVANWLDTEGRPFGVVFWRFMLPEGEIATPTAEVVSFSALRSDPSSG